MKQPICVYRNFDTYGAAIRECALPFAKRVENRRDSGRSSAVRYFDMHSLRRIPIGAPNSQKYLIQSSYEFVLSSLFIFNHAWHSLRSSAVNEFDMRTWQGGEWIRYVP